MKHVNIKFSAVTHGHTLAQREFPPGIFGNVSIYRVENVPHDVTGGAVLRLFVQTIIPFPDQLPTPFTVDYSQLGAGKTVTGGAA